MGVPPPPRLRGRACAAGGFQTGIGLVLLSFGRSAETDQERRKMYRLSAWFLVPAALNLAGGYWYITIASPLPQNDQGRATCSRRQGRPDDVLTSYLRAERLGGSPVDLILAVGPTATAQAARGVTRPAW